MLDGRPDPLTTATRPFERRGFFRRTLPLGLAAAFGLTTLLLAGYEPSPRLLALGLGWFGAIWALSYFVPWTRLPRWAELVPPLLLLLLLVGLRARMAHPLAASSLASLFLIPMFWVALFGTPREVAAFIVALALARVGFAAWAGHGPDIAHASVAVVVASTACLLTNQIVTRLRGLEQSVRPVLERLPVGFAIIQRAQVVFANEQITRMLGYRSGELAGRSSSSLLRDDEAAAMHTRVEQALAGEAVPASDRRFFHCDGGEVILETQMLALRLAGEPAVGMVVRDVTDERLLESAESLAKERLATERARLVAILGAVRDGVVIIDQERRGIYANPAYLELFAIEERDLAGLTREAFIAHAATLADEPTAFAARFASLANTDEADFVFARPRRRIMRRTFRPLDLPDGPGYLVVWHDVTADRDLVKEREQQALTDALTGLPNRRAAEQAMAREVARARRQGSALAVALLDVDHFKSINDRFGHQAGDAVLRTIAGVVTAQARITDTVARWGGEEFLAVLPGEPAGAAAFCERVRAALAEAPCPGVGRVTISAGVAPVAADDGNAAGALRVADARLYDAKRAGRDRVVSEPGDIG